MGSVKRTALDFGNVVDVAADADARHPGVKKDGGRGKGRRCGGRAGFGGGELADFYCCLRSGWGNESALNVGRSWYLEW
jgi:hypothetical protein